MNVMNQITSMKDSGISWIGKIPKHWRITRIKYLSTKVSKGTTPTTIGQDFTDSGIRFIKAENIANGQVSETPPVFIDEKTHHLLRRSALNENDVLVVIAGATTGKAAHLNKNQLPANTNQAVAFVRAKDEASKSHILYSLFSRSIQEQISLSQVQSAQPNLSLEDLGNLVITEPLPEEQKSIAQFLDRKTAAIDALIAKKQRLIKLLEEKRSALINQAVTKGLNPNAPMKDSGIPWIGKIPEHWKITKLKRACQKITDGEHISPESLDEGVPLLSAKDVGDRVINYEVEKFVSKEDAKRFRNRCNPEKGDVLMVSRGATIGRVALVESNQIFCLMGSVILLKPSSSIYSLFLYFLLNHISIKEELLLTSSSSAQQAIYLVDVAELFVQLPTIQEQVKIANYLNSFDQRSRETIRKIYRQINTLQEYRQSVITAAVTGKLDVTQAAVP